MLLKKIIFKLILEKGEKHQCEQNIDWLPPVHAQTGTRICNLLVYRMTLQPSHLARAKAILSGTEAAQPDIPPLLP